MGWTDREPHFTAIQNLIEEGASFDDALSQHIDNLRDAAEAWHERNDA